MVKGSKNNHPYKRSITHTAYKHGDKKVKKGKWSRMLHLQITENQIELYKEAVTRKGTFYHADDKYMEIGTQAKVTPIWGGGFSLFIIIIIIIGGIKFPEEIGTLSFIVPSIIAVSIFSFFAYYYFTMPHKECIFNREDGLVTFPGFYWQPNITMPVTKVLFIRSAPSAQGIGSHLLQIARPDKSYSLYMASLDNTCYEDLSFYLWYMDKNRPLPPGSAFDEFRDVDFERRKKAGFPKPLFPAAFDTPEATPEQQAERKRIGGW